MIIEKGIEPPTRNRYPFATMEVGDSVVVDGKRACNTDCPAYNAAMVYGYRTGKAFSGKRVAEGKVRIWRVQ
tara:strand:- start:102 stop:317 length:216 start_codon:yes stop_codon:yes gene_type:complete